MFPTKNYYESMSDMNRLFPRSLDHDIFPSPNKSVASHSSPFRQSTPINRSSSSADSTSPDSFPDFTSQRSDHSCDNYYPRRQRPIIGRKIFDNVERPPPILEPAKTYNHDISTNIWQTDDQLLFSPSPQRTELRRSQNLYELFPTENKGFEFRTPNFQHSPAPMQSSPIFQTPISRISPTSSVYQPRPPPTQFRIPNQIPSGFTRNNDIKPAKMCTFCRKNGETPLVYMTHTVKEKVGGQQIVTCPILRSHVCLTCGASGDNAHTITYCPVLRSTNNGQPLQSTTITLKNTRIKSNGRRRF